MADETGMADRLAALERAVRRVSIIAVAALVLAAGSGLALWKNQYRLETGTVSARCVELTTPDGRLSLFPGALRSTDAAGRSQFSLGAMADGQAAMLELLGGSDAPSVALITSPAGSSLRLNDRLGHAQVNLATTVAGTPEIWGANGLLIIDPATGRQLQLAPAR